MQLYLEYRLKRIVTGVWANQSGVILDHLSVLCENEKIYGLMKAQTLIINRQRQEASWILDDFKRTCEDHESRNGVLSLSVHIDGAGAVLCGSSDDGSGTDF